MKCAFVMYFKWPPRLIFELYDVEQMQANCNAETNIDRKLLEEFETTRDLKNLPDTRELRCYFYCMLKQIGFMKENSTETHPQAVITVLEKLHPDDFERYIKMNRKCTNKQKEPCDKAYAYNKCWKLNSPEVWPYTVFNVNNFVA